MAKAYYNTNDVKGKELKHYEQNNLSCEKKIYLYFKLNSRLRFTPFDINKVSVFKKYPITSIRRAITNLTDKGYIIKTDKKAIGIYGKPNYLWTFKK